MSSGADLIEKMLEAYGGLGRWQSSREWTARVRLEGASLRSRFRGDALKFLEVRLLRDPLQVQFLSFPKAKKQGVFESSQARIESSEGEVLLERRHSRSRFQKFPHKYRWDDLDLIYFAGCTLLNTFFIPYVYAQTGFDVREGRPWKEGSQSGRRLRIIHPMNFPVHSREHLVLVHPSGFIHRTDYAIEILGPRRISVSQYFSDYKEFEGFMLPTQSKVLIPGDGKKIWGSRNLLNLKLDHISITTLEHHTQDYI